MPTVSVHPAEHLASMTEGGVLAPDVNMLTASQILVELGQALESRRPG